MKKSELSSIDLDIEVWKKIKDTDNQYVSNLGRVKRVYKNHEALLNPYFKKHVPPYYIKINGKEKKVSHVVWEAFVGPIANDQNIIHRYTKNDDRLANLEAAKKHELGKRFGGMAKRRGIYKVKKSEMVIYDYYANAREAAKKEFCSYQTIIDSCNRKYKNNVTGFDFIWANIIDNKVYKKNERYWKWKDEVYE